VFLARLTGMFSDVRNRGSWDPLAVALAGRTGACREVGRVIVRFIVAGGLGTRQIWAPSKWAVLGPCSVLELALSSIFAHTVTTKLVLVLSWYISMLD